MQNILDYGARGDGETNDAPAIQRAIDACAAAGGGVVLAPAGRTFLCGQLTLRSGVNLHIESGARLAASLDAAHYATPVWLRARDAQNVAITGHGTLDGQGKKFMKRDDRYIYWLDRQHDFRPRLFQPINCTNLTMRDVTFLDAPEWTIHPVGCQDVVIDGVRILNSLKIPNCDGIDPDNCRNVRIANCHIEAGDDCIVLKSGREFGPCENITVTGCTLVSTSCALKVGTGPWTTIRDVVFDSCIIKNSNRGVGIQLRDPGDIENIVFSNMIIETRLFHDDWWGKAEPIHISAVHRSPVSPPPDGAGQPAPWTAQGRLPVDYGSRLDCGRPGALGRVRHIRFSNILCRGENGVFISGSPDSIIEDVLLDNVRLEINKTSKWPGGMHDRRPPEDDNHLYQHRTAGVFIEHARGVALRGVTVVWGDNRPSYFGPALECRHVQGLELRDFQGEAAHPQRCQAIVRE